MGIAVQGVKEVQVFVNQGGEITIAIDLGGPREALLSFPIKQGKAIAAEIVRVIKGGAPFNNDGQEING